MPPMQLLFMIGVEKIDRIIDRTTGWKPQYVILDI